jgi:hypothetical protein
LFRLTLQNWTATLLVAETRKPPIAIFAPGLLVEGCETLNRTSPVLMPETVKLCSVHPWLTTLAGVIEVVSFSNCSPPLWVVLTNERVVEVLSRYCRVLPVFHTSPGKGVAGAVPAGRPNPALAAVDAAMVCLAVKVFAEPSCAKAPEGIPFSVAAFTPVREDPPPLKDDAVTLPFTVWFPVKVLDWLL